MKRLNRTRKENTVKKEKIVKRIQVRRGEAEVEIGVKVETEARGVVVETEKGEVVVEIEVGVGAETEGGLEVVTVTDPHRETGLEGREIDPGQGIDLGGLRTELRGHSRETGILEEGQSTGGQGPGHILGTEKTGIGIGRTLVGSQREKVLMLRSVMTRSLAR